MPEAQGKGFRKGRREEQEALRGEERPGHRRLASQKKAEISPEEKCCEGQCRRRAAVQGPENKTENSVQPEYFQAEGEGEEA